MNIHAAASGTTWYATDFNPAQAGFAQSLARASGAGAYLFDEAFADFCRRPDLPPVPIRRWPSALKSSRTKTATTSPMNTSTATGCPCRSPAWPSGWRYWVRGARKLNALEQAEALRAQRVTLVQPRADVSLKVAGSLGEATMQEAVYGPILDALADHQPRTLGEVEKAVAGKANFAQVMQAAMVLAGSGTLLAVQDDAVTAQAKPQTDRLNACLIDKARGGGDVSYLASPVTGSGILAGRIQQLFLLARSQGKSTPEEWAVFAWQVLSAQGQQLLKEGKTLTTPEDNLAELTAQAREFAEKRLPILEALQVA